METGVLGRDAEWESPQLPSASVGIATELGFGVRAIDCAITVPAAWRST